jgi:hypothetical protein
MAVSPSKGWCTFAMAFQIERGKFGESTLDGLGFIVLGHTPEAMGKGDWSVGLLIDERANDAQREAITGIASGQAGGPIAALSGLVGKFLGAQPAKITFAREGANWSVTAPGFLEMSAAPALGMNPNSTEPLYLDNTGHPAADRFALARALKTRITLPGFALEETSGKNNGQYAPFSWRSA